MPIAGTRRLLTPLALAVAAVATLTAVTDGASAPLAAARPAPRATTDSVRSWAGFYSGRWSCAGAFVSGRPLAADVTFTPELDGRWLAYSHVDRAPGQYRALALLGPLPADTGTVTTVLHDNGGGQRRFAGRVPTDGALVIVRDSTEPGARPERFTFRRTSDSTFWFAWELRRTPGAAWSLGDSLSCRRAPSAPRAPQAVR